MKASLLPDRGVVKVSGESARAFLNGLLSADIGKVTPDVPCFAALLTPQGKIIVDCIVVEAPVADGGGFFLDCPAALAKTLAEKLVFYKLRAKITIEDLSRGLGVLAVWGGNGTTEYGLVYRDPRESSLGLRVLIPQQLAQEAATDLGASLVAADEYEAHRIAIGIPRGGFDFIYGDAFPHDADMDQLHGVDFSKGCYVGQEIVSRMEHRGTARTRIVPFGYDGSPPEAGTSVMAGDKMVGTLGSTKGGNGIASLRLDRVADAIAAGTPLTASGIALELRSAPWIHFPIPGVHT